MLGQIQLHLSPQQFAGISDLFNAASNKDLDLAWRSSESGCRSGGHVIGPIKPAAERYQGKGLAKRGKDVWL
jgi:hypothetical protein